MPYLLRWFSKFFSIFFVFLSSFLSKEKMLRPFLSLQYKSIQLPFQMRNVGGKRALYRTKCLSKVVEKRYLLEMASKIGVYKRAFVQGRIFEIQCMYLQLQKNSHFT